MKFVYRFFKIFEMGFRDLKKLLESEWSRRKLFQSTKKIFSQKCTPSEFLLVRFCRGMGKSEWTTERRTHSKSRELITIII